MDQQRGRVAVVAGGGYAGVMAANRLRGRVEDEARVILIAPGAHMVDRVRLHEAAASGRDVHRPYAKLLAAGVEHVSGHVVALDAAAKRLRVQTGDCSYELRYDALILALGSRLMSAIPSTSTHAEALRDPAHALRLAAALRGLAVGERVIVVGGGLTGIELSAEIADAYPRLEVELVASELAPDLAGSARDALHEALASVGVRVREGCTVRELSDDGVTLADGTHIAAKLSVLAAGFEAAPLGPQLAPAVRRDGRIAVDAELRVHGCEDVFAAGDLAAPPSAAIGSGLSTTRMACATAMPLGAHAADQVVRLWSGAPLRPHRFGYVARCISVGRRNGVVVFVDSDDRPTGKLVRGRTAALIKEALCRSVIGALRVERLFGGAFSWPRGPRGRGASAERAPSRQSA